MTLHQSRRSLLGAACALALPCAAIAQAYPAKPITVLTINVDLFELDFVREGGVGLPEDLLAYGEVTQRSRVKSAAIRAEFALPK